MLESTWMGDCSGATGSADIDAVKRKMDRVALSVLVKVFMLRSASYTLPPGKTTTSVNSN